MAQANVIETAVVGNVALSVEALPSIVYRDQPVITTDCLSGLYGVKAKQIRDNLNQNRNRFVEGKHFFKVEGEELRVLKDTTVFNGVVPSHARHFTLYTARGSARHAKMLNTDKAWDVFELLEENYFHRSPAEPVAPILDGPISLTQQQEIRELVDAKVSAYPDSQRRKAYGQIYKRLAVKFKVPRYQELPVSFYHDARAYLIGLDVKGVDTPALPAAEPVPALPPAPRRVTFEDYQKLYPGLVCGPQHWELLRDRIYTAMDVFMTELKAVQKEAINPFQINRKSNVQNYLDAAMGPMHNLWDSSTENMRMSYKNAYDALDGCRDTWMLLHKG